MSELTMAQKIKQLREQNKLTLEEVGNAVGVGKSTVRKWETGMIANMRRDKIAALAEVLHTTPAYLMGWNDNLATEELLDLRMAGAKSWSKDVRFTDEQRARITDYLTETELRQKQLIEEMANCAHDGKIVESESVKRAVESVSTWVENSVCYINCDFSDNPLDERHIKEEYIAALSRLSVREQIEWLVRIQDYIDQRGE